MNAKKPSIIIICLLIILSGFGCREESKEGTTENSGPIEIKMWGVFDNTNDIYPFIRSYQAEYPHVKINYQKKSFSEYENVLLNGLASRTGPDIFVMHNTWLPKYEDKISPVPEDMISLQAFRDTFVSVTEDDLIDNDRIYALPLYVDTLVMYYNYDHYRATKYGKPAPTWKEFTEDIKRLNIVDPSTRILNRSAVALGTENNVDQSADILMQFFLQYGVNFYNSDHTKATFSSPQGVKAFEHYLSFSNPKNKNYSWNASMDDDIYNFINGKVSTIIGYSYLYEQIAAQSRTKGLDFRIAAMPQLDIKSPINYADYWAYTVNNTSGKEDEQKMRHAWNFIKTMVSEDSASNYLENTMRPAARRLLVEKQESDNQLGVFAKQVRYAKSVKSFDREKYNQILEDAIEDARTGNSRVSISLSKAAQEVNNLVSAYIH